ncbi:TetR/AcrR family transcriptional regulator [Bacillus ndiopicus]|uniref:TetR/AcrR family transcriptional regulator n=1 Tax=Bacillus ndiopicus TaxID=1347368 RepID=UPI0005AACCE3|nr:TetR/AcrR family transcriptional regulator [Bacillus ndiopicus]
MATKEQTLHAIKETAYQMFAQFGIDKTSFAMIAKEIGISKPALYYYFDSKDALVEAIFEEIYQSIEADFSVDISSVRKEDFIAYVLQFGYKQIDEQLQDEYFNAVFNEYLLLSTRNDFYAKRLQAIQQGYLDSFTDLLQHGVEIGFLDNENINYKATILAMVLDNISNYILTGYQLDYQKTWQIAVQQVLHYD